MVKFDINNKEEVIFNLLLSLNASGAGYPENRLQKAIEQYEQMCDYFKKNKREEANKKAKEIQAYWLPTNDANKKRCSNCDVIHLIAQYPFGDANWCPNCGATMHRKEEDDNKITSNASRLHESINCDTSRFPECRHIHPETSKL